MSVGKQRHFLQTTDLAGVGITLIHPIFEELPTTSAHRVAAVAGPLPRGFPESLIGSMTEAIARRSRLLVGADEPGRAGDDAKRE